MGSGCCDPRSSLNACPEDNFSMVCTLEIDGCKNVFSLTGETKDYHKQKRTALTSAFSLDACIADFEDGVAQFLLMMVSAPVIVTLTTSDSALAADLEVVAPTQAESGVGPYTLDNTPVVPSTVEISYSDNAVPVTMTDNGAGVLTGSNGDTGTINYTTGAVTITFGNGLTTAVSFDYHYTHSDQTFDIPVTSFLKIDSNITGVTITPATGTTSFDLSLCIGRFTL